MCLGAHMRSFLRNFGRTRAAFNWYGFPSPGVCLQLSATAPSSGTPLWPWRLDCSRAGGFGHLDFDGPSSQGFSAGLVVTAVTIQHLSAAGVPKQEWRTFLGRGLFPTNRRVSVKDIVAESLAPLTRSLVSVLSLRNRIRTDQNWRASHQGPQAPGAPVAQGIAAMAGGSQDQVEHIAGCGECRHAPPAPCGQNPGHRGLDLLRLGQARRGDQTCRLE